MSEQQTAAPVKCTYCSKPAEKVVKREIHDRSRDPYTNRPCVRTRTMEFCSAECGGRYQMGCEG